MTQGVLKLQIPAGERRTERDCVVGEIASVSVWHHDNHDWIVARVIRDADGAFVRCLGRVDTPPEVGCRVRVDGRWETHAEHGEQFIVSSIAMQRPRTTDGILRYIDGNVRGFGEAKARRLVQHFGTKTLEILSREPERVREAIPRASESTVEAWVQWADSTRAGAVQQRLVLQLMQANVTAKMARNIIRFFKSADVAEILMLRHPYRILQVPGFGWQKADEVARTLGLPHNDVRRVDAAVVYAISRAQNRGHTALPADELARRASRILGHHSRRLSAEGVDRCVDRADLRLSGGLVYLPADLQREYGIAECLRSLIRRRYSLTEAQRRSVFGLLASTKLSTAQREAVLTSMEAGVSVLTGLPGSGKTTTVRALVQAFREIGKKVLLVAPTGKAASRAAQVTLFAASTIHRAIATAPGNPREEPLPYDVVIVDESGMVGLGVAHWLLGSIDPTRTQVIWVGDENQLPSVEHGFVLGDLLGSGVVPCSRLTEIFRQGEASAITQFARAILRDGDLRSFSGDDVTLRTLAKGQELNGLFSAVDDLVRRFGTENVSVLAPYKRNALGVRSLNRLLQERLNPNGALGCYIGGAVRVRVGDRVIQTRNTYDLPSPVFNGETGVVRAVDSWEQTVEVDWGDRTVALSGINVMRLELAWATTIHRSQGSEYPAVAVFLGGGSSRLLSKQLLYTAATRAKEHLVVLETPGSMERCLTHSEARRHTGLQQIIRKVVSPDA